MQVVIYQDLYFISAPLNILQYVLILISALLRIGYHFKLWGAVIIGLALPFLFYKYVTAEKPEKENIQFILNAVGMGKFKPQDAELTAEQRKKIALLIAADPNAYNSAQKSLVSDKQ